MGRGRGGTSSSKENGREEGREAAAVLSKGTYCGTVPGRAIRNTREDE